MSECNNLLLKQWMDGKLIFYPASYRDSSMREINDSGEIEFTINFTANPYCSPLIEILAAKLKARLEGSINGKS